MLILDYHEDIIKLLKESSLPSLNYSSLSVDTVRSDNISDILNPVRSDERAVAVILQKAGIPIYLSGFTYLCAGITMCLKDLSLLGSVTKKLYPALGKQYNQSSEQIERAIRRTLDAAWANGCFEHDSFIYNISMMMFSKRPTNAKFLALITNLLLHNGGLGSILEKQ